MVLGMSGLAMPISIFMIMNSPVHRQISHSLICSNRTVACLVRTSLPRQLWRPCKIMSRIITRYVDYTSLLLTCGSHGSTILPEPERSLTNFGVFLIDDTHRVSPFRPEGPEPPLRCRRFAHGYALDGSECPSYLCGLKEMGNPILCWIPPQPTRLTCTLPEMGCCVLGLALIKNIGSTMKHRQRTTKVSALSSWQPEVDPAPEQAVSDGDTSDSEGSESASDAEQNDPPSSLVADAEQYELMQVSYAAVGKDFHDQEDLIGSEYSKLQKLEMVPERWPLARLSFSLQKCVDHLDRVLAGCCWEVQATRVTPPQSLLSLHQVAKCLTMQLAFSGRF